jgi:hypothetical protein
MATAVLTSTASVFDTRRAAEIYAGVRAEEERSQKDTASRNKTRSLGIIPGEYQQECRSLNNTRRIKGRIENSCIAWNCMAVL